MKRVHFDRLYGKIHYSDDDLRLYQIPPLTRLRQVSLSAIPTWLLSAGVCASKFEHSVGVGYLAKLVSQKSAFSDAATNLYLAALLHDIGTPPFSHATEYFQIKAFGINHEAFAAEFLEDKQLKGEILRLGGDPEIIFKLITGDELPLSKVINGSIDLDNLDNTLRFGLSMGLFEHRYYDPTELARAFDYLDDQIVLRLDDLDPITQWDQCRQDVYEWVYSPINLSPGAMLFRALDFAFQEGELTRDFFFMTDAQAYDYLLTKCNPRSKNLVDKAKNWLLYTRVFDHATEDDSSNIATMVHDLDKRSQLGNVLAKELHTEPENVSVLFIKDKGYKTVDLPILASDDSVYQYETTRQLRYLAQVYVHPSLMDKQDAIAEFLRTELEI